MPILVRRRIFRPDKGPSIGLGHPSRRVTLTVLAGGLLLIGGIWTTFGSSEAPASSVPDVQITVDSGRVAVIDGATLRLAGRVVQLDGVTVPGHVSSCEPGPNSQPGACGRTAANALARLIQDGPVTCHLHGGDPSGRPLALCTAGGLNLNKAMGTVTSR